MTTHGVGGPGSQPMEPKSPKKEKQQKSEAAKKAEEVIAKKDESQTSQPFTFKKLPKELPPEIAKFADLKDAVAFGRTEKATKITETTPFNQEIAQKVLWEVMFHVDNLSPSWKEILHQKGRTLKRLDLCAPESEKPYGEPYGIGKSMLFNKIEKELMVSPKVMAEKERGEFDLNRFTRKCGVFIPRMISNKLKLSADDIDKLARYFPNVETLNLCGLAELQKTPNLREGFPHLQTLVLAPVDDKFLQDLTAQNLKIKNLVLPKYLRISPEVLIKFLASCKNLEHLELPCMVNDQVLEALTKMECAPKLKILDMSGCSNITDKGLVQMAHTCHNLEHLNVSGTSIGNDSVRALSEYCPHLLSLNLQRTSITDAALQCLPDFKKLKNLNLLFNVKYGHITSQALANAIPKLPQTLEALGMDADDGCLKAVAKARIPLKHLFLSQFSEISNDGIEAIAKAQLPLETLGVRANPNLQKCFTYLEQLPNLRCLITNSEELNHLDKYPKLFQACKNAYQQMEAQVHRESCLNNIFHQFESAIEDSWNLWDGLYKKVALGTFVGEP